MSQDRTSITLDPLTHHTLQVAARNMNVSLGEYVIRALQDHAVQFNKRRFNAADQGREKGPDAGTPALKPESQGVYRASRRSAAWKKDA